MTTYKTTHEVLAAHPKCFCGAPATDVMQVTNDIGSQWLESLCMHHVILVSQGNPRCKVSDEVKERMLQYLAS